MVMDTQDAPKVSIITCFLNVGQLLEEAVESVVAQTYQNWELWLIDDGSTDSSTDIAKKYAARYPGKIFYLEHAGHANIGASASRNVGVERCAGDLIAFLDGDDVWLPDLLGELVGLLQQHAAAMVCEATEYWYDWNDADSQNSIVPVGARQDHLHHPPQLILDLYPLGDGAAPCICGMLVRKDTWVKHGGFEAGFKGMYDDQAFLVKFYLNEPVYLSSGCHNRYRQRPGSLVHSSHASGNYLRERAGFLDWLEKYLHESKNPYPEVENLLHRVLLPFRHPIRYSLLHHYPSKGKRFIRRILQKFT